MLAFGQEAVNLACNCWLLLGEKIPAYKAEFLPVYGAWTVACNYMATFYSVLTWVGNYSKDMGYALGNNLWSLKTTLTNITVYQRAMCLVILSFGMLFSSQVWLVLAMIIKLSLWPILLIIDFYVGLIMTCYHVAMWPLMKTWSGVTALKAMVETLTTLPQYVDELVSGKLAKTIKLPVDVLESSKETTLKDLLRELEALKLAVVTASGGKKDVLEAKQPGSDFVTRKTWPKGLVLVRNSTGFAVGMGFIHRLKGILCLVTAAHVAVNCKSGLILSAGIDPKHVSIREDARIILIGDYDIVAIQVPENTMASLGVSKTKIGKMVSTGTTISVHGYDEGNFVQSLGVMGENMLHFGMKHSASTLAGFSGTPIYKDDMVVGIHSRSDGTGTNYCIGFDFLIDILEGKDYDAQRHAREREEWDEDEYGDYDAYMRYMDDDYAIKSSEKYWMSEKQRVQDQDNDDRDAYFEEIGNQNLQRMTWNDAAPVSRGRQHYEDAKAIKIDTTSEPAANFQVGPSHGAINTSNGTEIPKIQEQTTSKALDISTSTQAADKKSKARLRKKNSKKSRNSSDGHGPTTQSTPSEQVLESTPIDSKKEVGFQEVRHSHGSPAKSYHAAFTQELTRLGGINDSSKVAKPMAELIKLARAYATEKFPRAPLTSSKEKSETSSQLT